jgi:hypothetical protein
MVGCVHILPVRGTESRSKGRNKLGHENSELGVCVGGATWGFG